MPRSASALKTVGRLRFVPKDLEPLRGFYATLPKEPLMVRAALAAPYVPAYSDGSIHLDSLLSYAVYAHLPYPVRRGGEHEEGAVTPLPLKLSWIKDGLPLWCASDLRPQGDAIRGAAYWHKRWPETHLQFMDKKRANTKAGRNKEMRVPLATVQAPELRAICIGDRRKVEELLSHISHVGKKSSQGYGRVAKWEVEPLENISSEDAEDAALRARPIPLDYLGGLTEGSARLGGFTPPYWYAPWWRPVVVRA